jgi:hypothetical protein
VVTLTTRPAGAATSAVGEQKRRQVIGRPGELESVGALLAAVERVAGVVDENVDPVVLRCHLDGYAADLGLHGQVGEHQHRGVSGRNLGDLRARALAACPVPRDHHDLGPLPGELLGGFEAEAAAGASDHHHLVADRSVEDESRGSALKDEVGTFI